MNSTAATMEKQLLVSVPGVTINEAYGGWMKATRTFRQKSSKIEPEKKDQPKQYVKGKSTRGNQMPESGSSFDVLREGMALAKPTENKISKNKEMTQEWRKKEEMVGGDGNQLFSAPEVQFKGVLNDEREGSSRTHVMGKGGQDSKGRKKQVERERDTPMSVTKENTDLNLGSSPSISTVDKEGIQKGSKKQSILSRPKVGSPLFKKKQQARLHHVIIGSTNEGPSPKNRLFGEEEALMVQDSFVGHEKSIPNTTPENVLDSGTTDNNTLKGLNMKVKPPDPLDSSHERMKNKIEGMDHGDEWYEIVEVEDKLNKSEMQTCVRHGEIM